MSYNEPVARPNAIVSLSSPPSRTAPLLTVGWIDSLE
jgi:hypothetical protein